MLGNTLQRMVFKELLGVFLLSLLGLTGLFLLGGIVQEAAQRGLTPSQIGYVVPLLIPSTLPYTVPATILFATCIVFGRMAHDNEITAIRGAGVHLGRLLAPAIALAILVTAGLTYLQIEIIPRSRQLLAGRVLADADQLIYGMLKRQGCIRHPDLPYAVFVRDVRGKQLIDPVFKRRGDDGTYKVVGHAKEAKLWVDAAHDKVCIFMPHCAVSGTDEVDGNMRDHTFEVNFPASTFRDTAVRPMNMTRAQINAKWDKILDEQESRRREIEELKELYGDGPLPAHLRDLRHHLEFQQKDSYRVQRAMRAELNMRPALAMGGLFFILVAFPVGVWFHRADYLSTFVSCFLPIVMVYYPLVLAGTNLAKEGRLPAFISVWIADAFLGIVGVLMLRKLFRQ